MLRSRRNSTNSISTSPSAENDGGKGKWGFGSKKSPKNTDELQLKHQEAVQALVESHQEEVEELKARIAQYEEHDKEMTQQAEQEHQSMQLLVDQMEELTAHLNAKEDALQHALADQELMEVLKAKVMAFESESPVNEQLSSLAARQKELELENQQLKARLEAKSTTHSGMAAVPDEATVEELKHTIKHLEKQLEVAEIKQQNLTEDHTQALAKANEAHAEEMLLLDSKHTQEVEALHVEIQKLQTQLAETSKTHQEHITLLQGQVTALRDEHANEMDEILAQLDLVEAEHAEKIRQLQAASASTNGQDSMVINALTTELSTKTSQLQSLEQRLSQTQQQLSQAEQAIQEWQTRYQQTQQHYEAELEQERNRSNEVADEARQEMIAQAESQFEQANQMYMQLKQEYTSCLQAKQLIEEELEASVQDLEALQSQVTEQQTNFQEQLESLQRDLENVQQIAVHDKQHFHAELERFQEVHDGLVRQLEEAQDAHRTLEKTLAMLVMEKEAMAKENIELKGVCEETMALLETYEQKGAVVR